MRILTLYILRSIAAPTLLVTLALLALSSIMVLVNELEDADQSGYGLQVVFQFVALKLPASLYELMPTIMLIGALLGLGSLASSSELIVMRASGVSLAKLALATAMSGIVVGAIAFVMGDWLVPKSHQMAFDLRSKVRYGIDRYGEGGAWFREENRYIYIEEIFTKESLGKVHVYGFDAQYRLTGALTAERARFNKDRWQLESVRMSTIEDEQVKVSVHPQMDWLVSISPNILSLSVVRPVSLTTAGLWQYGTYLSANNLDAAQYWTELWRKLAMPITIIVMSLVAIPFVSGSRRSGGAGQRLFVGVLIGVGFYLLNEIVGNSGEVYGLPPYLTALLPTVIVFSVVIVWLRRYG